MRRLPSVNPFHALLLSLGLALPAQFANGAEATHPKKGHVCFQADFENAQPLGIWSGATRLETGYLSDNSVVLERKANQPSSTVSAILPIETMRGCTIRGTAMVRADNVSPKPNSWNGIKCMLIIEGPNGKNYPQAPIETGTFDWRQVGFTARIPADAVRVSLVLGLEEVTGTAHFDNIKLVVVRPPAGPQPSAVAGPMFTGRNVPRLRGAMVSPSSLNADSLRVLGHDWNANLIRWQLIHGGEEHYQYSSANYDAWLDGELKKLDALLPICEQLGIFVNIDIHSPPGGKVTSGGYMGSDGRLFTDKACQDKFVEVWQRIATRYKNVPNIWGYDIANEPVEEDVQEDCDDWQHLAERTAQAIRKIDPTRAIIVEPTQWGDPSGLKDFIPLTVSNVIYSVHMYIPHAFTHQRLNGKGPAYRYPGEISGKQWNKEELERALQPAIDFQKRYNVQIYIGEFSAIRWAPDNSACRYLGDVIDICEKYQWDWSYHAYREWQGWSVEHGLDPANTTPEAAPTDRQKLLCRWFELNEKGKQSPDSKKKE